MSFVNIFRAREKRIKKEFLVAAPVRKPRRLMSFAHTSTRARDRTASPRVGNRAFLLLFPLCKRDTVTVSH